MIWHHLFLSLQSSPEKPNIKIELNKKMQKLFENKYFKLSNDDNENDN